ncbi:MAG: hypothetical protein WD739_07395 [Actinomycetota bacterium]
MAPVGIPGVQASVSFGAAKRNLNAANANAVADQLKYGSRANFGHAGASFRISDAEYTGFTNVYRDSAIVELEIKAGFPDAGDILYTGFVSGVLPLEDGSWEIQCAGFGEMVAERQDPKLWRTDHYDDWEDPTGEPFTDAMQDRQSDVIDVRNKGGAVTFIVRKGAEIKANIDARAIWFAESTLDGGEHFVHRVRRVKGRVKKTAKTVAWGLRIMKYPGGASDGPGAGTLFGPPQGDLNNTLANGGAQAFDATGDSFPPMVGFEFYRRADAIAALKTTVRIRITDLQLWGDAFRAGNAPNTYVASEIFKDIAALLGFDVTLVTATADDILPYWHQEGSWATDLFDRLAEYLGNRWGVWDIGGTGGPQLELKPWSAARVWTVNGFTSAANVEMRLDRVDPAYSEVIVTWRRSGKRRTSRSVRSITPNPFAGAPFPLSARKRALRYHLEEPQRGPALADKIATLLATDNAGPKYSGTVRGAYGSLSGSDTTLLKARGGDICRVADWPGGSKDLRILEANFDEDDGAMVLTVGEATHSVESLIFWSKRRDRMEGHHNDHR